MIELGNSSEIRAQGTSAPVPQLEGFTFLQHLGTGPSGHTWHARTKTGRSVALKLLSPKFTQQPGFLTRFEKETAPLTVLSHPHIGAVIDRGRRLHQFYLATEYISGGSLRRRFREPVEFQLALRLVIDVSQALHHAHMRGLLHRGLKPENIFLLPSGAAKVVDFGLARLREDEASGTSLYIAPEQRTRPAYADGRADIYALATILYELLYGELPPRPWSPAAAKVPVRDAHLFALFSQSLAQDPEQRFRRMRDFSEELERVLKQGAGPSAPSIAPAGPAHGPLSLEVRGRTISVKVRFQGDAERLKHSLLVLEKMLRQPGPWGVAYDLTGVEGWSTREVEVMVDLHRRYLKNLLRVGFCSALPSVRGVGVLVGTLIKELAWSTFASPQAMLEWVERGAAK